MIVLQYILLRAPRSYKRYLIIQLIFLIAIFVWLIALYYIYDQNNKVVLNEISQITTQLNKLDKSFQDIVPLAKNIEEMIVNESVETNNREDVKNTSESIVVENNEHIAWKVIERIANAATLYSAAFPPKYEEIFNRACDNYLGTLNGVSVKALINSCTSDEIFNRKNVVLFDTSSSELTYGAVNEIYKTALIINKFNISKVYIEGYADKTGEALFNQKLSRERAEAVANYLKQYTKGSRIQLTISASGRDDTPVPTPEGVSEPLNRSVSIFLHK